VSTQIDLILQNPTITGAPLSQAYNDAEVAAVLGNQYVRLSDSSFRCYTTSWGACSVNSGGTVTTVSVVTANGVSGSVANATTTPAITLTLGNITPTSVVATATNGGSSSGIQETAASPFYAWEYTGGGTDQKWWDEGAAGSPNLIFRAVNDADTNANTWLTVTRGSGYTISNETFGAPVIGPNFTATSAAPTVSTSQIGYGGTTAASSSCGSLSGAAGCVVINVAGTAHYIPYY
jgi:hypothetical protein